MLDVLLIVIDLNKPFICSVIKKLPIETSFSVSPNFILQIFNTANSSQQKMTFFALDIRPKKRLVSHNPADPMFLVLTQFFLLGLKEK